MGLEPTTFSLGSCEPPVEVTPQPDVTTPVPKSCTNAWAKNNDEDHAANLKSLAEALLCLDSEERQKLLKLVAPQSTHEELDDPTSKGEDDNS